MKTKNNLVPKCDDKFQYQEEFNYKLGTKGKFVNIVVGATLMCANHCKGLKGQRWAEYHAD